MNKSLDKFTTSNLVRMRTQGPRELIAAMKRAEDQYWAKLERAKVELGEALKKIYAAMMAGDEQSAETPADPGAAAAG